MNPFPRSLFPWLLCLVAASPLAPSSAWPAANAAGEAVGQPPSPAASPAQRFNLLNSRIRDGGIGREAARAELRHLLAELRGEYFRWGGAEYGREAWVFPLAGYDGRALPAGGNRGYVASGYDYFAGNRHGGHPSFDIFIHDRNRDCRDDRSGKPVEVLSLTGGLVVALEPDWPADSRLRGGRYLWIYDPAHELLVYYAHNDRLFVELGQLVRPGDLLASVGRSGLNAARRRSPTHLHLTVLRVRDGLPLPLNVAQELGRARTVAAE